MTDLVTLTKSTSWYGRWSGYYEQLPRHLGGLGLIQKVIQPRGGWAPRFLGKAVALAWGTPRRNQSLTWAEYDFVRAWQKATGSVGFIASAETHLPLLRRWQKAPNNLVATIHFPPAHWTEPMRLGLRSLSSALVLYSRDLDFFEAQVGAGRVRFVPHGVDCDFFAPATSALNPGTGPRVLVVGQFDRDFALIGELARRLGRERRAVEVDLVVAAHAARIPGVAELMALPNVRAHSGVSDGDLRDLYRRARLLLLPMKSSGANNAIVEALACGLPIVTNDGGGIRDYGGGTAFPLAGSSAEVGELLFHYLDDDKASRETGARCRAFAKQHLPWPKVAAQHWRAMQVLGDLSASPPGAGSK